PRDAQRPSPISSTRTGSPPAFRRGWRASRTCSRSTARTPSWPGGRRRSSGPPWGRLGWGWGGPRRCRGRLRAPGRAGPGAGRVRGVVGVGRGGGEGRTEPDDPPHALFVGRLSEEKGVLEVAEAARDLPLVVVGDGPLRDRMSGTVGFVPPAELPGYFDRAAV